jgi:hypothetical protein
MKSIKELSRPLEITDVDFRVQSINNGGYATILAYKDARVDMNRLDEVLTPLGWQRDYKLIDGKLFCGVGIYNDEIHEWIWKWDVGTESQTEAEKGQVSDAFKRACFNLGIGRELYGYPVISVKLHEHEWSKESGRPKQTYNLRIREWTWYSEFNESGISFLAAKDENGNVRFKWGTLAEKKEKPQEEPQEEPQVVEEVKEESQVDTVKQVLTEEYKKIFGKAPHGRMSTERIKQEIDAELDRLSQNEESDEPQTEPAPEPIMENVEMIETFTDTTEFIQWAKDIVAKHSNDSSAESIEAFKKMCNEHYAKIAK